MENVQQLYDQAFQYWESNDKDKSKAKEYIGKALELAPDDLSVRALAMHIHQGSDDLYLEHAEYIIDHDIYYKDTIDKNREPHEYLEYLVLIYSIMLSSSKRWKDGDDLYYGSRKDPKEFAKRAANYTKKILQCGFKIEHIKYYLEFLEEAERYDELLEVANFIVKSTSAEELGLAGLEGSEMPDPDGEIFHEHIMNAFLYTGRNQDALEWCIKCQDIYPDDWTLNFAMGEVYCRLNQPEETARQWIIALQKGAWVDWFTDQIDDLCDMVADKEYIEKSILRNRLHAIKEKVPDDRKALFDKINLDAFISIGKADKKLITDSYVEGMLQMKLPPVTKDDYSKFNSLWLPRTLGPNPYLPADPRSENGQNSELNKTTGVIPKTLTIKPDTIEKYGIDITQQVNSNRHPKVVGRDREIDALIRILIRMEKNNPVLLGDAGVGKTAIILGLAQRIMADNVPEYLKGKRIIELSMSSLVGGTMWRGDFETRITNIIKELRENKDIILFVDELHTIMGAGAANRGDLDVANIAKPALAKGEIRLVGATTNHEYSKYIEKDQAMARRFTPVRVAEMDREATLLVLRQRVNFWRNHHHVNVPEKTLIYAVDITEFHMRHRRFPDKVIDLLDESCAYIRTRQRLNDGEILSLSTEHVNQVFREWTGTAVIQPEEIIKDNSSRDTLEGELISKSLQEQVVAQTKVISQLTTLTLQIKHSVKDPILPFILLFYGQPGTGKTTAANALANTLWPNEQDRVMVINMMEYSDPLSLYRLVGGPPGYAGYDEEGLLAARIKRKPFSIIMLKNIREASPQIIQFFSSLFRTGIFADKTGQDVLAGDIIFILHFDTKAGNGSMGFTSSNLSSNNNDQALDTLKKYGFPTSWSKVYFQALHFQTLIKEDIKNILNIHIQKLKNLYLQKGITISFSEKVQEYLINTFYEMPGEKRNMEMLIDQYFVPKLREKMLKSKSKTIKKIIIEH